MKVPAEKIWACHFQKIKHEEKCYDRKKTSLGPVFAAQAVIIIISTCKTCQGRSCLGKDINKLFQQAIMVLYQEQRACRS